MKRGPTAAHCIRRQTPIEGRQLPLVGNGEGQQASVCHLSRRGYPGCVDKIGSHEAQIVGPKYMARPGAKLRDNRRDGRR